MCCSKMKRGGLLCTSALVAPTLHLLTAFEFCWCAFSWPILSPHYFDLFYSARNRSRHSWSGKTTRAPQLCIWLLLLEPPKSSTIWCSLVVTLLSWLNLCICLFRCLHYHFHLGTEWVWLMELVFWNVTLRPDIKKSLWHWRHGQPISHSVALGCTSWWAC